MLRVILDGQEIEVTNRNDIEVGFSSPDVLDPNLIFSVNTDLTLSNLGFDTKDPYRIIFNSINSIGIDRPIPLQIEVIGSTFIVQDLFLNPIGDLNDLNGTFQVINNQSLFFKLAEDFNLKKLDPSPAPVLTDLQIRQLYDDFISPIATLRARYTSEQINPALQINPATDYTTFYYLDRKFRVLDVLILLINIYFVINVIITTIKFLADALGAAPFPPISIANYISTGIYIAFQIANLVLLILAWKDAIPKAIEGKCIKINKLIEKACTAIGFTYTSDFWNSDPFKDYSVVWEITADEGCIPIPDMHFSDFLAEIMNTFNLRAKQIGNTVRIEPLNYFWTDTVNYIIPMLQERENVRASWDILNTSVSFEFLRDTDSSEKRLGDGFSANYTTNYTGLNPIKGNTKKIESSFSRVYTKDSLTTYEQIYNTFVDILFFIIFFPFSTIFPASSAMRIDNVIGCAQFDENFINSPKIFIPDNDGRIRQRNKDFVAAGFIYGKCHKFLSPKYEGQFYIVERENKRDIAGVDTYTVLQQLIAKNACFCEFQDPFTGVVTIERCLITDLKLNLDNETVSYKLTVFKNYVDPSIIKETIVLA